MELQVGELYKHFKGNTLVEKNIYEILAINIKYTGDNDIDLSSLVIYRPLFQDEKYFAREYSDLTQELNPEEQELYHQTHRIELLTDEETEIITTEEYRTLKEAYIEEKYKKKF